MTKIKQPHKLTAKDLKEICQIVSQLTKKIPAKMNKWWERVPDLDKRIARGDDFAGDAWRYIPTGEVKYTAVNHGPPTSPQPSR